MYSFVSHFFGGCRNLSVKCRFTCLLTNPENIQNFEYLNINSNLKN